MELHELIESIRIMLASSMTPPETELQDLHGRLSAEIRQVNKRLRECDSLLSRGHRSEAILLAEQEPNLLERVAVLDFAELPEWNDFVAELGLSVAPELEIDIAADLNHAYADGAPAERYLRRLRMYSLGRAPLRTRINLLRKLMKVDGSPHWADDLRSYEEERLRQIRELVQDACEAHDHEQLLKVADELHNKPWSVSPDPRLIERIDKILDAVSSDAAISRLRSLLEDLLDAREADDAQAAIELVGEWEECVAGCDRSSEEYQALRQQAAGVLSWAGQAAEERADQEESTGELRKLQRLVSSPRVTLVQLERQLGTLTDLGQTLPEELADRVAGCRARLLRHARLQRWLRFGAAGLLLVVFLVLLVMFLF